MLSTLTLLGTAIVYHWQVWGTKPTIYGLWLTYDGGGSILLVVSAIAFFIILFWFIFHSSLKNVRSLFIAILLLTMVCSANWFVCGASLPLILSDTKLYTAGSFEGNHYYVTSQWKVGVGGASAALVLLWQCDTVGLSCDTIYSQKFHPIFPEEDYKNMSIEVTIEPVSRTISLRINSEVVYSQPL